MDLKNLLDKLLNPRSNLEGMPGFAESVRAAQEQQYDYESPMGARGGIQLRDILSNPPFMLGAILVLGLFALVLFGPVWAPQNPYIAGQHIVPHLDRESGEFIRPPLEPSEEYPLGTDQWGADILSLLMHGARNTLVACAFITMLRILLGLILGALAGWNEDSWIDRLVMALIGMLTSLPLLIVAMILIYALDIRRGLSVFIIALSVVGWTEIAQYIRSEFLVLKQQPFIEGANAVGMTGTQIAIRQVLPNVLHQLLVITFLEMGAVLMLLGELGFVGTHIGGGSRIDLSEPMAPPNIVTLAEVPEWGAMIAGGVQWLVGKPHVVWPPAIAFFIAVVAFNTLGEGLRRLIEKRGVNTAYLLKRRMLLVIAGLTLATVYIMNNTGAAPWFAEIARNFNGDVAYEHIAALSEMEGRGVGQPGSEEAAAYIAARFEEYGLEPAWRDFVYEYPIETVLTQAQSQPTLSLLDSDGGVAQSFTHQLDFGFVIDGHGGSGEVSGPLTFMAFQPDRRFDWEDFVGLDLKDRIVVLVRDNVPADFVDEAIIRGAVGVLWITDSSRDAVHSQIQLAGDPGNYMRQPQLPIFQIRPNVAEAMLASAELTLADIFGGDLASTQASQQGEGWVAQDLDVRVAMSLQLAPPEATTVPAVIGYLPGSDLDLSAELVVLAASYDSLGTDPDGTVYPGVNRGAAGVGIMLELARLWQEQSLEPRRTVILVAWPRNQLDESGLTEYLNSQFSFRHLRAVNNTGQLLPAVLFQLDYTGAGSDILLVHPQSNRALAELIEDTSQDFGLQIFEEWDRPEFAADIISSRPAWISFKWLGDYPPPGQDTLDRIDREKLQQFGQTLALAMTRVLRETNY